MYKKRSVTGLSAGAGNALSLQKKGESEKEHESKEELKTPQKLKTQVPTIPRKAAELKERSSTSLTAKQLIEAKERKTRKKNTMRRYVKRGHHRVTSWTSRTFLE